MMTEAQRERFKANALTDKDKADILREGPFCPYAQWGRHVTNGMDRVHCRLLGAGAHIRISPDGLACAVCKNSPQFAGAGREYTAILADDLARSLGTTKATAEMRLDRWLERRNVDASLPRVRELLVSAAERAPALSGLPEADALQLALDRGWVSL